MGTAALGTHRGYVQACIHARRYSFLIVDGPVPPLSCKLLAAVNDAYIAILLVGWG